MASERRNIRGFKAIVGAVLVGLGMFILYENVATAIAGAREILGGNGSGTLGLVPAFVLSISHALQAYAPGQQCIFHRLLEHVWLTSWPLLLVRVGIVLTRERSCTAISSASK